MDMHGFTTFVLLFGDHYDYHRRCLASICNAWPTADYLPSLRIGMNAVCARTRDLVHATFASGPAAGRCLLYDSPVNRLKYPLMRKMFYDKAHPVVTPYTMWFDDDSYITADSSWWQRAHTAMANADMLGRLYTMQPRGLQVTGIAAQPWYGNMTIRRFVFATGGWWSAKTRILQRWNYPWPELIHNGGDTTLGELMRQQKHRLVDWHEGVRINADLSDGDDSSAPRRSDPASNTPRTVLWEAYGKPVDLSRHDFDIQATTPQCAATLVTPPVTTETKNKIIRIPGLCG